MRPSRTPKRSHSRHRPWLWLAAWLLLVPIGQLAHLAWEPHVLCSTHGVQEHRPPAGDPRAPEPPPRHDGCDLLLLAAEADDPSRIVDAVPLTAPQPIAHCGISASPAHTAERVLSLAPKTSPPPGTGSDRS